MALHPLQVADALAGFAAIDFLSDDWATSRSLALTRNESEIIRRLVSIGSSSKAREAYADWKRSEPGSTPAPASGGAATDG